MWSDRYIPLSDDQSLNEKLQLNIEETNEYLEIMEKERQRLIKKRSNTEVAMYRALQFQKTNDFPYYCSAGRNLLTVMENADLVPCRRMPIVVGNLLKTDMYNLYINNKLLKVLRGETIPDECKLCEYEKSCQGGLKCLTYAIYKDLNHKDIGCEFENS